MTRAFDAAIAAYNERRWQDTIDNATAALDQEPHNLDALEVFGLAYFQLGEVAHAIQALEYCHQKAPDNPRYASNLGELYRAAGRLDEAIGMLGVASQLQPDALELLERAALACLDLGEVNAAITALSRVAELKPDNALVHFNLGEAYRQLGQYPLAIDAYRRALQCDPQLLQAHQQLALSMLAAGDYLAAWPAFEWRLDPALSVQPQLTEPRWAGQLEPGKRVFVYSDQGLGDAILFSRYLPLIASQGVALLVEVPQSLLGLFRNSFPGIEFVPLGAARPHCDWQIALASLPALFGTSIESVPNITPYLQPGAARLQAWQERLAPYRDSVRVAVRWAGNPQAAGVKQRDCPIALFASQFADIPQLTLVNLQLDRRDEFATLSRFGRTVDFGEQIEDFEDTAALLANVELLISVDTAVLNLAGAMHLPAWGILPFTPEWRWQGAEQRSIWYPELTLYRQAKPGDWQSALDASRRTLWSHLHAIHA